MARNGTEAEKEKIEALWWCEGVREGRGYKRRKNETKRERERGRETESGGVGGREGERRRRQIEVESGEGEGGGCFFHSGLSRPRALRENDSTEGNNILNRI